MDPDLAYVSDISFDLVVHEPNLGSKLVAHEPDLGSKLVVHELDLGTTGLRAQE